MDSSSYIVHNIIIYLVLMSEDFCFSEKRVPLKSLKQNYQLTEANDHSEEEFDSDIGSMLVWSSGQAEKYIADIKTNPPKRS